MPPKDGAYIAMEANWYETTISEGDKWVKLEKPRLCFCTIRPKMMLSEKQLEKIEKYLKTIESEDRKGYVVARIKDGKFIPMDIVVNQKSLLGL